MKRRADLELKLRVRACFRHDRTRDTRTMHQQKPGRGRQERHVSDEGQTEANKDIARYYDNTRFDYAVIWQSPLAAALHYGYWTPGTRTLSGALKEQTRTMARAAQIRAGDRILDAGCGIAGPACLLAREWDAHVTGITLSETQLEAGRRRVRRHGLQHRVHLHTGDYLDTGYEDQTFDVVWAQESACYARDKRDLIREARRILRPGGRLVVADGFASERQGDQAEQQLMRTWLDGWKVPNLTTLERFASDATAEGFRDVRTWDMTEQALPSARRLHNAAKLLHPAHRAGTALGLRGAEQAGNIEAAHAQYLALRRGLWKYGMIVATREG